MALFLLCPMICIVPLSLLEVHHYLLIYLSIYLSLSRLTSHLLLTLSINPISYRTSGNVVMIESDALLTKTTIVTDCCISVRMDLDQTMLTASGRTQF